MRIDERKRDIFPMQRLLTLFLGLVTANNRCKVYMALRSKGPRVLTSSCSVSSPCGLSATAPFFHPCTVLKGVARIVSLQVAGKHQLEEHFLQVLAFIRNQGWTEVDPSRTTGLVLFQTLWGWWKIQAMIRFPWSHWSITGYLQLQTGFETCFILHCLPATWSTYCTSLKRDLKLDEWSHTPWEAWRDKGKWLSLRNSELH